MEKIIHLLVASIILLLAVVGFVVSLYIFLKKRRRKPLTCFLGHNCNVVVNSKYQALLGVPNELVGVVFYALMLVVGLVLWSGVSLPLLMVWLIFGISLVAALFSVILTGIQWFILHDWCEYCLLSSAMSIAIVIVEIMAHFR